MRTALVTVMILFTHVYQLRITAAGSSNETLYKENVKRCQAFNCGPPQPRAFRYQDVMHHPEDISACEDIHPHVTILHRCDNTTGYCSSSARSSCEPETLEEVSIVFMITLKHTSGGCRSISPKIRYVETMAVNHTHCACHKGNLIK